MMSSLKTWLLVLCALPLAAHAQSFDATFYHLDLDLRFAPDYLYGRTRVEGRAVGAPLATLTLDLSGTMRVDSVRAPGGGPLPFSHDAGVLAVALPAPVAAGQPLAVEVFYQGLPQQDGFGTFVFGRRPNGDPFAWTLSEPYGARAWWPSRDHPSDKADSVRVTVTVPADLRVGSNGLLERTIHNGDGTTTYDWFSRYPIASYLVSFAAGRYDVHEQVYRRPDTLAARLGALELPVLHYEYRGSGAFAGTPPFSGWHLATEALPLFEHWFGPYPFAAEKYGHAHVTFGGGMEHQTMSSMGNNGAGLVAHELAHQWYGDLVTTRSWPHLWLNEGFATYGELLFYESRPDWYADTYRAVFDLYYRRARSAQGTLVVEDTTTVNNLFASARVYSKGAMVLHMLRGVVGDATFRDILRAYAAGEPQHYGTATTADFQRVAEAVAGRNLGAFFRQWVTEGTGHPVYEVRWGYDTEPAGHTVRVTLEQTQAPPLSNVEVFEMPVTFAVETAAGTQRFTVANDARVQTYTFAVEAPPQNLVFDPDQMILHDTPVATTPADAVPARPEAPGIAAVYPNPARAVAHAQVAVPAPGPVQLALYDVLGRRLRLLADAVMPAGLHTLRLDLTGLPAGTYFVRMAGSPKTSSLTVLDF